MKFLILISSLLFITSAHAAKFTKVAKLSGTKMEALAKQGESILKADGPAVGDASSVERFKFTRKPTESDLNTVKQMAIGRYNLIIDESGSIGEIEADAPDLGMQILLPFPEDQDFDDHQIVVLERDAKALEAKIQAAAQYDVQFFHGVHHYEDGTWTLFMAVDPENNELLVISFGSSGT